MTTLKKHQPVTVKGTKTNADRRPGKFIALHPGTKGNYVEVQLDGAATTTKFRESQVQAA